MEVLQTVSLTVVLLMALYGCAQAIGRLCLWMLRPRELLLRLVLPLKGAVGDVEQQLRLAQKWSESLRIKLFVVDQGADEETKRIAKLLLKNSVGEWVASDESETNR